MRQFYVMKDTGLTITDAEQQFEVEIRPLDRDISNKLFARRLIAVEGSYDDVYRLFDKLCPGTLSEKQKRILND